MNELVQVPWWVCVEAKRALQSVIEDKNSYYARVMVDDAASIRSALEHLESAIANRKGGQPQPTLTAAERESVIWAAHAAKYWAMYSENHAERELFAKRGEALRWLAEKHKCD